VVEKGTVIRSTYTGQDEWMGHYSYVTGYDDATQIFMTQDSYFTPDFEVPYLLGVTYPKFISVFAYDIYFNGELSTRPLALAANFILVTITAILGICAYKIMKKWDIKKEMRW